MPPTRTKKIVLIGIEKIETEVLDEIKDKVIAAMKESGYGRKYNLIFVNTEIVPLDKKELIKLLK